MIFPNVVFIRGILFIAKITQSKTLCSLEKEKHQYSTSMHIYHALPMYGLDRYRNVSQVEMYQGCGLYKKFLSEIHVLIM